NFGANNNLTITTSGGNASTGNYTLVATGAPITGSVPNLILPEGWTATASINGTSLVLSVADEGTGTYESWAAAKGLNGSNNGTTQNPDADKFFNIEEYAYDLDPFTPEYGRVLASETALAGGNILLTLAFKANSARSDINYVVRRADAPDFTGNTLVGQWNGTHNWTALNNSYVMGNSTTGDGRHKDVNVDFSFPNTLPRQFLRVDIEPYDVPLPAEVKAFPTAEGFGRYAQGGRGGRIIQVTNLNGSGNGSFRAACEASGPRIVVFKVSGTIPLGKTPIEIKNPYLTIAGQTAPGDGICIRDARIEVRTHNVVIRHIRVRPGDEQGFTVEQVENGMADGIVIGTKNSGHVYNVVLDHLSVTWTSDDIVGMWNNNLTQDSRDVSIQNCIIAEPLAWGYELGTPEDPKGPPPHGYAMLMGDKSYNVAVHNNLFTATCDRMPKFGAETTAVFANNVIYNWAHPNGYKAGRLIVGSTVDYINNYYKVGPLGGDLMLNCEKMLAGHSAHYHKIFLGGNYNTVRYLTHTDPRGNYLGTVGDWTMVDMKEGADSRTEAETQTNRWKSDAPFSSFTWNSAADAYAGVLATVGATVPRRDRVDTRIIDEVITNTGTAVKIGHVSDIDTYPTLLTYNVPTDTDRDGMPDAWETARGLNPNLDDSAVLHSSGYTMIEVYLNELAGD
ncbi:MAG: hypothetical protein HC841_07700, partial [Verrucomicrobiae bacterium]|nr:hypothetical protein [Verrucomicrobiae bacterium]